MRVELRPLGVAEPCMDVVALKLALDAQDCEFFAMPVILLADSIVDYQSLMPSIYRNWSKAIVRMSPNLRHRCWHVAIIESFVHQLKKDHKVRAQVLQDRELDAGRG